MMRAYHFVGYTLRDGRPVPADGEWLEHDGPLVLCLSGLHASVHPFDALRYAPGATLCLVDLDGEIIDGGDKVVARRRRIVRRADATKMLRYFARMQALSVIHLWPSDPPDVVLEWLMTGDTSLRSAAWSAARSAAWSAARSAAWSAARSAAESAAWSAESAAESAAWSAESAAWSAWSAESAARAAAGADFLSLVEEGFA